MNILTLVCIASVMSVVSVASCIFSLLAWISAKEARKQSEFNAQVFRMYEQRRADPNKVYAVEIDQPPDKPVPVQAVQAIRQKPPEV